MNNLNSCFSLTIASMCILIKAHAAPPTPVYNTAGGVNKGNDEGVADYHGVSKWRKNMPMGFVKGGEYILPFKQDTPVFTISHKNVEQYAAKLSAGHQALLKKFPSYRLPIFPAHRPVAYPPKLERAIYRHRNKAELSSTGEIKINRLTIPFIFPNKNPMKMMWNHKLRYRGDALLRISDNVLVVPSQEQSGIKIKESVLFTYANLRYKRYIKHQTKHRMAFFYRAEVMAPQKFLGGGLLVHEPLRPQSHTRQAFYVWKGDAKAKPFPSLEYDTPNLLTHGLTYSDQADMFNGAMDRYQWQFVAKKTMYIPYNNYQLNRKSLSYKQLLGEHHLNPEHTRYEPHRVWVVDAINTGKAKHPIKQRRFYLDEDSWTIVMADIYDQDDRLWQFQEGHTITAYDVGTLVTTPEIIYDLKANKYVATQLTNENPLARYNRKAGIRIHKLYKQALVPTITR